MISQILSQHTYNIVNEYIKYDYLDYDYLLNDILSTSKPLILNYISQLNNNIHIYNFSKNLDNQVHNEIISNIDLHFINDVKKLKKNNYTINCSETDYIILSKYDINDIYIESLPIIKNYINSIISTIF